MPCVWRPHRRRHSAAAPIPRLERLSCEGLRPRDVDDNVALAAELGDRRRGIVQRLAVPTFFVLDCLNSLAFDRPGNDHSRAPVYRERFLIRAVDGLDVVAIGLDRCPAERLGAAANVGREIPAVHCLAALAEPVHVENRDQVVEFIERGVLERLPHRALGRLAVSAQHPYARGRVLQLPGERDADGDREALPRGPRFEVHPREDWGWMPLKARADTAERQQLSVGDRAARLVDGVEQRRGVALREDQMIVARVVGLAEKSYRRYFEIRTAISSAADIDDVGWPDFRHGAGTNGVDAQLLRQLTPEYDFGSDRAIGAPITCLDGRLLRRGGAGLQ